MKIEIQKEKRAKFTRVTPGGDGPIHVHFNPGSLQLTLNNTLDTEREGETTQYIKKSSSKLSMDLIFDSTDRGSDVREDTGKLAAFMNPVGSPPQQNTPPTVLFEWGTFAFQGLVESYKETLDFFSREGVPLRASVSLTMARQDLVFSPGGPRAAPASPAVEVPPVEGDDVTRMVSRGGNPQAGRAAAARNGLESMRFPSGPVTLDASITLGKPAAFASGGAGLGLSLGVGGGIGLSAGAGFGVSGGISAGASLGVGASAEIRGPSFGGSASAGLTAGQGAFAGLRISTAAPSGPPLDPARLLPRPVASAGVSPDGAASFRVGGQANLGGAASFRADVGASASLGGSVRFDGG